MMSSNPKSNGNMPKLGTKSGGKCVICSTPSELKCQGCVQLGKPVAELPFYCGKDHQLMDWKSGHKTVCVSGKLAYQFKITLIGVEPPFVGDMIEPPIWRRIQIRKSSTFRDLHKAISLSMGWFESHLHEFRMASGTIIGMPNDDDIGRALGNERVTIPEKSVKLVTHFKTVGDRCVYEYDFGDGWTHEVLLEKICPMDEKLNYPNCIDGARACPPEGMQFNYNQVKSASD